MITALSLVALGFSLGLRHAADPDHVIAVSTIVTRERTLRGGLVIGLLWGVGHTLTIVAVGGAIILFNVVIPPRLGLAMEMVVAVMLIMLGIWRLRAPLAAGPGVHAHPHRHGDDVHSHTHGHGADDHGHRDDEPPTAWLNRHLDRLRVYQLVRPLLTGLVHGLAGSAAVALLVLATITEARWAIAYLVLFGIGTIVGMVVIAIAIAAPLAYASRRVQHVEGHVRVAAGLLSVGFGLFLVYHIGFVDGLFTPLAVGAPK